MIAGGANARVYPLACGVTDLRKVIDELMALLKSSLRQKTASGSAFVFHGQRGNRIKLLFLRSQGFCLYYQALKNGRFP
ncbi:transposase [Pararhizobium capsulatum DSM 1112]|uniref:Transposase n=1 Tax=Pararhizobium capsulatum DSM 1112 TaxID=1121113 RepID=A0ABU0BPY6_9HYPH|nr:IS66 family insertion sequence element accessory protein TnpB [Pararhizobium capsulatum]MDQ0320307.1 transposase [Pararhizobium capsulatum DSM 1112]